MNRAIVKCPKHFVVPYMHGMCAMVFDARQRHMTKAINLTSATHCRKIGFFFATKETFKQTGEKAGEKRQKKSKVK